MILGTIIGIISLALIALAFALCAAAGRADDAIEYEFDTANVIDLDEMRRRRIA